MIPLGQQQFGWVAAPALVTPDMSHAARSGSDFSRHLAAAEKRADELALPEAPPADPAMPAELALASPQVPQPPASPASAPLAETVQPTEGQAPVTQDGPMAVDATVSGSALAAQPADGSPAPQGPANGAADLAVAVGPPSGDLPGSAQAPEPVMAALPEPDRALVVPGDPAMADAQRRAAQAPDVAAAPVRLALPDLATGPALDQPAQPQPDDPVAVEITDLAAASNSPAHDRGIAAIKGLLIPDTASSRSTAESVLQWRLAGPTSGAAAKTEPARAPVALAAEGATVPPALPGQAAANLLPTGAAAIPAWSAAVTDSARAALPQAIALGDLDVWASGGLAAWPAGAEQTTVFAALPPAPAATIAASLAGLPAALAARATVSAEGPVEVMLAPAELGNLRINFRTEGEVLHVTVMADRPETLELVRRNADLLAQEFRQAGFAGTSFSFGQSAQGQHTNGAPDPGRTEATEAPGPVAPVQPFARPAGTSGLDLRV